MEPFWTGAHAVKELFTFRFLRDNDRFSRLFAINISLNAQLGLGFVPTSVLLFANSHFVRRPLPSARTPPPPLTQKRMVVRASTTFSPSPALWFYMMRRWLA